MKPILISYLLTVFHVSESIKNPIILIPGLGGSPIDVKIDPSSDIKSTCKKKSNDFFKIWLDVTYALTHTPSCIYECLKMTYDPKTRRTSNRSGIQTRMPGLTLSPTNEYLTATKFVNPYFNKLVKKLVKEGYTPELSVRAAMFDFRKGPSEHSEYFQALKQLIEETYRKNGEKRVVLISHSLGGLMATIFLDKQEPKWKKQYIRFLITLSAPWAGAVKAIESYYKGFGFHGLEFNTWCCSTFSEPISSRPPFPYIIWPALPVAPKVLLRTWPSLIWLFPSSEAWKNTDVLVKRKDKQYTWANIQDFFNDLQEPEGWEMYQDVKPYVTNLPKPDVELYCLYGVGVPTVASVYSKSSLRFPINGNGDGIVNLRSLEVCHKWVDGTRKVTAKAFKKVHHQSILSDSAVFKYIMDLINRN